MGCPLMREWKQQKIQIFIYKSVGIHFRESVCLWECVNTDVEFDWELTRGIENIVCFMELSAYESIR